MHHHISSPPFAILKCSYIPVFFHLQTITQFQATPSSGKAPICCNYIKLYIVVATINHDQSNTITVMVISEPRVKVKTVIICATNTSQALSEKNTTSQRTRTISNGHKI